MPISVTSPKSCVIGQSLGPGAGQEHQDGREESVVTVPPLSSQRPFSTLPSVDSAVESWDGSNVDSSFTSPGKGLTSGLLSTMIRDLWNAAPNN